MMYCKPFEIQFNVKRILVCVACHPANELVQMYRKTLRYKRTLDIYIDIYDVPVCVQTFTLSSWLLLIFASKVNPEITLTSLVEYFHTVCRFPL